VAESEAETNSSRFASTPEAWAARRLRCGAAVLGPHLGRQALSEERHHRDDGLLHARWRRAQVREAAELSTDILHGHSPRTFWNLALKGLTAQADECGLPSIEFRPTCRPYQRLGSPAAVQ
jgi:hypothetical protein